MITIIIPCYNIETHLSKCIESVLNQTFQDFELLLINDGSKDRTLEICQQYQKQDQRIKVFSHENKGVSFTRNKGIEEAKRDYIMFIDGDDWIERDMLSCLVEAGLSTDTTNVCGMIHERNGKIFKDEFYSTLVAQNKVVFNQDEFISLFPSAILSSPCCKVYNREILIHNNIRFIESLSFQEDLIFNLPYFANIKIIRIVPVFKYHYVEHEISSSSRFHPNLTKSVVSVSEHLEKMSNYTSSNTAIQKFNIDQILKLIANYLHNDSGMNSKKKLNAIKEVMNSKIFEESKGIIKDMALGKILKWALQNKNILGILLYFQMNELATRMSK